MDIQSINKKLLSGFLTLTFRRVLLYAVVFANTNLLLARILTPDIIGIFNIGNSILALFSFFSDIGLAAAIIQKKEITSDDLKTTFTVQQVLSLVIFILVFFSAPFLANFTHLPIEGMWLIRVMGFGFFLTSLKVLPSVLLERELKFGPLVFVEMVETISYLAVLDYFVMQGLGVTSYSYSVLTRGVLGVIAIYIVAPWRVSVGVSKASLKQLLKYGVPYQLNSVLAFLKDRLVALIVANIIGPTGVGFVTWAQNMAFVPLEVMNIMTRITFPAFSRLQHDQVALKQTLERSIFFISLLMYPILFGVMAIAPSLVEHVVRSNWRPALPMIYFFSITAFWAALSTPFTNFLNAIGKIGITLKLMVMWTILEWIITPFLAHSYGFIGVAYSSAIISFSSIIPIIIIKKIVPVQIIKNIYVPFLSASIMGILTYLICQQLVVNFYTLLITIVMGGLIYCGLILIFAQKRVLENFRTLKDV